MLEQTDLRQFAIKQVYKMVELSKTCTFEDATGMEKYYHSNLTIVPMDDVAFQICPYEGQMAYGIFTFVTTVKGQYRWSDPQYEFVEVEVLVGGRSIEKVQEAARQWFMDNRQLDAPMYTHRRSGRIFTTCYAKLHNRESYVPRIEDNSI